MTNLIEKAIDDHVAEEKLQVARYAAEIMKGILLRYEYLVKMDNPPTPEELIQWGKDNLNSFRKHYGLPALTANLMSVVQPSYGL